MSLLPYVLAAANVVAPGRDHTELGTAIATRAEAEAPLFADDPEKELTASLLIAVAFRESSLDPRAEGDHDAQKRATSFCAFQIHLPAGARTREGWTGADLVADVNRCVSVGFRLLRGSLSACRGDAIEERLAWYARGRCGSKEGKRLSRDRMRLAQTIRTKARASLAPRSSFFVPVGALHFCAIPWRRPDDALLAAGWS